MEGALSKNMKLLSHDVLRGFGGIGEGMSMQIAADGRRIMWLAHEGAPMNFSGVDVSDPRRPAVVVQTTLPHNNMRSNSLEVCGNILAVAYQTAKHGMQPAGVELFDVSVPEEPRSISFFDMSGPYSRGAHCLWFVDGEFIHCAGSAADFKPLHPRDDQFYVIIDVRDPARPREAGRWWYPGTREGDEAPPPPRLNPVPLDVIRGGDAFRLHNANVYPERPDRAYIGYIDGGAFILDISDKSSPKVVSAWNPHPPYPGFTHTVMPLFDRGLIVVTDECIQDDAKDWPKLTWMLDAQARDQSRPDQHLPDPVGGGIRPQGWTLRLPQYPREPPRPVVPERRRHLRVLLQCGPPRLRHQGPVPPRDDRLFRAAGPENSRVPTAQMNDIYVDERGVIYAGERWTGGLYCLEADI